GVQFRRSNGLGKKAIDARVLASLSRGIQSVCGECDNGHSVADPVAFAGANASYCINTIEARHVKIGKKQIEPLAVQGGNRSFARLDQVHKVTASFEQF